MIWFWLAIAVLACAATASLVLPLLGGSRQADASDPSSDEARRIAIYRDRRAEIEAERLAGRLSDDEARQAQDDLLDEAATLLPIDASDTNPSANQGPKRKRPIVLSAGLAVVLPLTAVIVYGLIGSPAIIGLDAAELRGEVSEASLNRTISDLQKRVEKAPRDGEAWAVLGQAQRMANNIPAARAALEKAVALLPEEARVLADYAEVLVLGQGGDFSGQPIQLLERALKIDPNEQKSVALMAAAQYRAGHLERALGLMRQLVQSMTPDSNEALQIGEVITRIEKELSQKDKGSSPAEGGRGVAADGPSGNAALAASPVPGSATAQSAAAQTAPGLASSTVSGSITLDDSLRGQVPEGTTLFVLARGTDGSRIPLAATRMNTGQWPLSFELSDAQAMNPQRLISTSQELVIEARISRSGNAMRQSGDLIGTSTQVKPGTRDIQVLIDQRIP